jgi:hypothetical protein
MRRTTMILLCAMGLGVLALAPAAQARKHTSPRRGGHVHLAWPKTTKGSHGKAPKRALARWLARQVGPTKVRARKPKKHARVASAASARAAISATAKSDSSAPVDEVSPNFIPDGKAQKLDLVRSFDIPRDDPAYARLVNLSFTYDSAIAAISFVGAGNKAQAEMLLDQLAALQRDDGLLDLAYDTTNGNSARLFRTGTVAWTGLAATIYRNTFKSAKYGTLAHNAAAWILAQQGEDGLLRGGPDVKWVSTQNNIIAAQFLQQYKGKDGEKFREQGKRISDLVVKELLVDDHFVQGSGDDIQPTDVQALGAMLLNQRGDTKRATAVVDNMIKDDRITDRSISLSKDLDTYNMTYEAKGPFTGFRPYADKGSPDVLWFEWTVEARVAMDRMGVEDRELAESMKAWQGVTAERQDLPLGADRTVSDERFNEFHVWPASAAGSWLLLQQTSPELILPAAK